MNHFEAIDRLELLANEKFPKGGDGRELLPIESFMILMSYHGRIWNCLADDFQAGTISPDEYFTACEMLIDESLKASRLISFEKELVKIAKEACA